MTTGSFAAALFDARHPVPPGLVTPEGAPATRRFDIYRNNVAVGLTEALRTAFPGLRAAMGEEAFDRMAAVFLRREPPRSPVLTAFGDALPAFLDGFAPLARYPWLGDLARLDRAMIESYHAADAPPLRRETLAGLPPARLLAARVRLAPATRLVRSRWPVVSLLRAALAGEALDPDAPGEAALILRPGFDPGLHRLPTGGATFMLSLIDGQTLAEATEAATALVPDAPIAAILRLVLHGGALAALDLPEDTP